MDKNQKTSWYREWFDTPFYHILYKHRDEGEAKVFLENLTHYLALPKSSKLLDIPCGKGRHAHILHELGYDVTGLDLSANNIKMARATADQGCDFHRHDMREIFKEDAFNGILNLFTSIGYFDSDAENQKVIKAFASQLKAGGVLVIDFLNVKKAIKELTHEELREEEGISFCISRKVENGFIQKQIKFSFENQEHTYQEKVRALDLSDLSSWILQAGLHLVDVFGDYDLGAFDAVNSDRLILIAKKP